MRRCIALWTLLVLLSGPAVAQEGAFSPWQVEETRLPNGLRVITHEDFSCPKTAVQIWYGAGSKHEPSNRQGLAHFLEHMMFRGSAAVAPDRHFDLIHAAGGDNNAFTFFDYTAYIDTVPADQLELALWLEAERMVFLSLDPELLDTERKVVEEERRMTTLNTPYGTVPERVLPHLYPDHPYGWLPLGNIPHLRAASADDLRRYWDARYVPANATLVIAGAVPHARALELARQYFGWIPVWPGAPAGPPPPPPQTGEIAVTLPEKLGPVPLVGYVFRGVPADHPDALALDMVMSILCEGETSRIYRDVVREHGRCVWLMTQRFPLQDDGVVGFVGVLHPVRYYLGKLNPFAPPGRGAFRLFDRHIEAIQREGVTPEELEKVKLRFKSGSIGMSRTLEGRALAIGEAALLHGEPEWNVRKMERIEAMDAETLRRVAAEYLVPERRTRITVLPRKHFDYQPGLNDDLEIPAPPFEARKTGLARPAAFPDTPPSLLNTAGLPRLEAVEHRLDNGLRVVVTPDHEAPVFLAALAIEEGPYEEPRPGLTEAALAMLSRGTKEHSARELEDLLEQHALYARGQAVEDGALFTLSGLSDEAPRCVRLLAEMVRRPAFPASEWRREKRYHAATLRYQRREPKARAHRAMLDSLFGSYPYGRPIEGTLSSVRRIGTGDLCAWWTRIAQPESVILYLGGDIQPEAALALAQEAFGDWQGSPETAPAPVEAPPSPRETRIQLIDAPGAPQSELRIAQSAFAAGGLRHHAAVMFTQVYAGAFGSRLNKALRSGEGKTYHSFGGLRMLRRGGYLYAETSTQTESTAQTLETMLRVLESMRETPPSSEEMRQARDYLLGAAATRFETFTDQLNYLIRNHLLGLPRNHLEEACAAYESITAQTVHELAQSLIDPDTLTIIVVGDAKKIAPALEKIAPVQRIKDPS